MADKKGKDSKWGARINPPTAYPDAWLMNKDEQQAVQEFSSSVREAYKALLKKKKN